MLWHVMSLTTLPSMACCCIAVLTHGGGAEGPAGHEACRDGAPTREEGHTPGTTDGDRGQTVRSCTMGDDALIGFLQVTAEVPITAGGPGPSHDVGRLPVVVEGTTALALPPPAPPPRA